MRHSSALAFSSNALLSTTALLLCFALPVQQVALASPAKRQSPTPPTPTTLTGPVPAQIRTAHTIFLANSGAAPNFPLDSTRVFNEIYADLQARGRYQLVGSPAEADLIFQLREVAPVTTVGGTDDGAYSYISPAFRITIIDPKTSITIWTINSPVILAGRKQVYNHWVSVAETNLVSRIEVLAGQSLTAEQSDDLTAVPKTHYRRNAYIVIGATVGLAVAGGLILHHEFENGLADQKSQTDAFCKANNIPLSECAGG